MTVPYPAPGTVAGRVLGALLHRGPMTGKACWLRVGSSRLAHHIWFLRENGWPILSQRVVVTSSDHDRKANIAEYWIESADIAAANKRTLKDAAISYCVDVVCEGA